MSLMSLIAEIRANLFSTPDTVCLERAALATQAARLYEREPAPLRRARSLEYILAHMSLDLESNPVFAGNMSSRPRAWMLLPEAGFEISGQALIENDRLKGLLDGPAVPAEIRDFWKERQTGSGWGHLAVDQGLLLREGLSSIADRAEETARGSTGARADYRRACAIACRAVIAWAGRYAEAAETAARLEGDPLRAALHRRVSAACRRVPAQPARDLFEALQSILLVHYALHIEGHTYSVSPGLLDRDLLSFYHGEAESVAWIAAFMLKLNANAYHGSHSKTQAITLAADADNPLTELFLDACELACVPDPNLFLRWREDLAPRVKQKASEMLSRGFSFPLLVGDEQSISGLVNAGIPPDAARDYCIIGCNELGIPGRLIWQAQPSPELEILRETLLTDAPQIVSMQDLITRMQARLEAHLLKAVEAWRHDIEQIAGQAPTPLTTALMQGGVERGVDHFAEMPCTLLNLRSIGFANLVNGLAALDDVGFTEHKATLAEVAGALRANFSGHERLRARLRGAPKIGNNDERADHWARVWLSAREDVRKMVQTHTGAPLTFEIVVRSLHHLEGRQIGATPDGRQDGQPLADSVGAEQGTTRAGPTALLNSACKLEACNYWGGGYNLNLTLPLANWNQPEMHAVLVNLLDTFFAGGGQELQVNSLDAAILRDAQTHPDRYGHLLVRIAGFNARFIDLSELEQAELIMRAENA